MEEAIRYHQLTNPGEGILHIGPVEIPFDPRPLPPWTKPTYPTLGCSRESFTISKKNLPANLPYRMDGEPSERGRYSVFWNTWFCRSNLPVDGVEPGDICFNQAESTVHMYDGKAWIQWRYPALKAPKDEYIHHPHFPNSRYLIYSNRSIGWYAYSCVQKSQKRQGCSPSTSPYWLSDTQMVTRSISRYWCKTPYDSSDVDMGNHPNGTPEPYEDHQEIDDSDDEVQERRVKRRRVSSQSDSSQFDPIQRAELNALLEENLRERELVDRENDHAKAESTMISRPPGESEQASVPSIAELRATVHSANRQIEAAHQQAETARQLIEARLVERAVQPLRAELATERRGREELDSQIGLLKEECERLRAEQRAETERFQAEIEKSQAEIREAKAEAKAEVQRFKTKAATELNVQAEKFKKEILGLQTENTEIKNTLQVIIQATKAWKA